MDKVNDQYRKQIEQINIDGEKYANDLMKDVYSLQKDKLDEIHTLIGLLYVKYSVNGLLNLTSAQKASMTAEIDARLKDIGKELGQSEVEKVNNILTGTYKDTYYKNAFVIDSGLKTELKFNLLNQKKIDAAVNSKLDGELFSDRIWQNKADIIDKLHKSLIDITKGDTTIDKAGKMIQDVFNVGAYESKRLMITELTRVQSQAQNDIGSNIGIKQHMWSATLDIHTCHKCAELDGKIFDIDDGNSPQMPLHPLDRCCWINVVPGWQPTKRIDNDTKEMVNYKEYDQWLKDKTSNSKKNYTSVGNDDIISNKKWLKSEFPTEKKFNKHIEKTFD